MNSMRDMANHRNGLNILFSMHFNHLTAFLSSKTLS